LLWVAIIAITGNNLIRSSILAALLLAVVPSYVTELNPNYQAIMFGVAAVLVALLNASGFDPVVWIRENLLTSPRVGTTGPIPSRRRDTGWRRASSARRGPARAPAAEPEKELATTGGSR
jgi:hypothetical protein